MKKIFFMLPIIFILQSSSGAQHYITPGVGYGLGVYKSDELETFKNTFNQAGIEFGSMTTIMKGLAHPFTLQGVLGYRYIGKLTIYSNFGFQRLISKDFAEFAAIGGRITRNIRLKQSNLFFEGGIGPTFKKLFLAGTLTVFFNKKTSIETESPTPPDSGKSLNGNYKGTASLSTDLGLAFGIHKDPIILSAKITYPLFSAGGSAVLTDSSPAKVKEGSSVFPSNYWDFSDPNLLEYKGVNENIDGLKIMVILSFLFKVKD